MKKLITHIIALLVGGIFIYSYMSQIDDEYPPSATITDSVSTEGTSELVKEIQRKLEQAEAIISMLEDENKILKQSPGSVDTLRKQVDALEKEVAKANKKMTEYYLKTVAQSNNSDGIDPEYRITSLLENMEFTLSEENILFEPGRIASTGIAVANDTPLKVGETLQLQANGNEAWAADIISLEDDGWVGIHYVGYDSSWDEIVPRSSLQLDANARVKAILSASAQKNLRTLSYQENQEVEPANVYTPSKAPATWPIR